MPVKDCFAVHQQAQQTSCQIEACQADAENTDELPNSEPMRQLMQDADTAGSVAMACNVCIGW